MSAERVRVVVRGLVQGVNYRASCRGAARRLGLTGFVRNLPDGSVEAVAEGPREALERFVDWCRDGPPWAKVTAIEVDWRPAAGEYGSFDVTV
jgi:acylphosphatase